jgi:hypothetical protein
LNENFNSEDEDEETQKKEEIDPLLAKIVRVDDGWLDKK